MTDNWMKGRVKGLHRETVPEEQVTHPANAARAEPPQQHPQPHPQQPQQPPPNLPPGGDVQQALQMLTLAQRTADEHVANAHRQAEQIHADGRATAEQIVRDAQAQADAVRREADTVLSDARAQAAQIAKDAQAHADNARRDADKNVSGARAQAAQIAKDAQASADGLMRQAQQRYEEMVGNLAAKREALQQQIEALQEFDRDYRARLLTFMQAQLRALWVEEPRVDGEIEQADTPATARLAPAPQPDSGPASELVPAQTSRSEQT